MEDRFQGIKYEELRQKIANHPLWRQLHYHNKNFAPRRPMEQEQSKILLRHARPFKETMEDSKIAKIEIIQEK